MKYYQNVERPILPPVDLSIMQKTYDTLEQGHLKGVELASKLRSAIAQLPLNESEQAYKDELASGIEQVITENSFAGNAYYAIPDLIKTQGDIDSNPVLINKINAQADYKAYQDMIDSNKELSADAKEYYKEMNPYRNGQKEDGSYDTTFKWQPSSFPTKVYDINDFIEQGIRRAAEEYTDYNSTVWLDADGNVTTDPMKALDGQIYYEVGGQRVVLSKDKIIDAINTVINATPGGNESIQQDYNVYKWKYNKQRSVNPDNIVISPITDANGEILSAEEFKQKLISEAASQAAYVKGGPKRNYGSGLRSYKDYKNKQNVADINSQIGLGELISGSFSQNTFSPDNITVSRNIGAEATQLRDRTSNDITNTYSYIFGKDDSSLSIKDKADAILANADVSPGVKNSIRNYYRQYEESLSNLEGFKTSLSQKDTEKFNFGTAITSPGGNLDTSRSKYDKQAMNNFNDLFGDKDYVDVYLTQDQMNYLRNRCKSMFDEDGILQDKGDFVRIPKDSSHSSIMQACVEIDNAFRETRNPWIFGRNLTSEAPTLDKNQIGKSRFSIGEGLYTGVIRKTGSSYSSSPVKKLADLYRKAGEFSTINSDIIQSNPIERDIPVEALQEQTFTEFYDKQAYNFGDDSLKPTEIRNRAKEEYNLILNRLQQGINPDENIVYTNRGQKDEKYRILKDEEGSGELYAAIKRDISNAAKAGLISVTPANTGQTDEGSWITIYNKDKEPIDRFYVTGIGISDASSKLFGNYKTQVRDNLQSVSQFGNSITVMSGLDLPYGNEISIHQNPDGYINFNIGGKTQSLAPQNAMVLYEELLKYRDIYDMVASGNITTDAQVEYYNKLMNEEIIPVIAMYMDMEPEIVDDLLDLSKNIR